MSLPPNLKVLCRRLTSTPASQLPVLLPGLLNHVLQCKDVLSSPQDSKVKEGSSEASMLVHKLKRILTTLLEGKHAAGRFAAAVLVKAVVDVGGWECLKDSMAWVRGLLAILRKNDPFATKEVSIITLTRIYTLVSNYQTLAREIATQSLDVFFKDCLKLIKLPTSGQQHLKTPLTVVEVILDAFSTLQPVYPATCRPFKNEIRVSTRPYLAPTPADDGVLVPLSLQRASRRLAISQHFNAASKQGPSEEWAKLSGDLLNEFHITADQVFRAVHEGWESSTGVIRSRVNYDGPAQGDVSVLDLPEWKGIRAGSERLLGLIHFMGDTLRYPTSSSVAISVGGLVDAVSRVAHISRTSKSQSWEQALETHPAIGRDEKEELWAAMPDIHVAALELLLTLTRRLGHNTLPVLPVALDALRLMVRSGISCPSVRYASYEFLQEALTICGPTMSKLAVDNISLVAMACCRDLQEQAGFINAAQLAGSKPNAEPKKNGGVTTNADLFLPQQNKESNGKVLQTSSLPREHYATAGTLLAGLLTHLPQRNLKPGLRGLLDRTAILSQNKDAMLASVLNPYITETGKSYATILPHLSRSFPHEQGVEILRSNLRTSGPSGTELDMTAGFEDLDEQLADEEEASDAEQASPRPDDKMQENDPFGAAKQQARKEPTPAETIVVAGDEDTSHLATSAKPKSKPNNESPFLSRQGSSIEVAGGFSTAQKRRHENGAEDGSPPPSHKRQDVDGTRVAAGASIIPEMDIEGHGNGEADESDDESVHLQMDLDDFGDEDDEEVEEEDEDVMQG